MKKIFLAAKIGIRKALISYRAMRPGTLRNAKF